MLLLGLNNFVACQGEVEEIELQNKNLRKENEELKASCASLEKQNISLQEKLNKTQVNKKVNKRSQKLQFWEMKWDWIRSCSTVCFQEKIEEVSPHIICLILYQIVQHLYCDKNNNGEQEAAACTAVRSIWEGECSKMFCRLSQNHIIIIFSSFSFTQGLI